MDFSLLFAIEEAGKFQQAIAKSFYRRTDSENIEAKRVTQLLMPGSDKSINNQDDWNDFIKMKQESSQSLQDTNALFSRHQFISADGRYIYHVSIIDYLQLWDLNKKAEHVCKTWFLGKSKQGLSAVDPHKYAARFLRFCRNTVFYDH
jgi:hypothetical protein